MPEFATPEPISVTLELGVGEVRVTASDRATTVVDVRPSDDSDESDVKAAAQVRVDFTAGTLRITGPKGRMFDFSRKTRSVDITVDLPSGSRLTADTQVGSVRCTGRLGETRLKTAVGHFALEHTGALRLDTSAGHVTADVVDGGAEVATGSGKVRLGSVAGPAVVKNSNGDTTIDAVEGDVRVRAANGDITVERAAANVDAKTSNGTVRLGEVARGTVALGTSMGDLHIGVAEGTAAWLAVDTAFGRVRNLLDTTDRPADTDETVEVRGHTACGDITVHRA
jgi:DUF4097 and DUF4098 domain-containing protein YvlB